MSEPLTKEKYAELKREIEELAGSRGGWQREYSAQFVMQFIETIEALQGLVATRDGEQQYASDLLAISAQEITDLKARLLEKQQQLDMLTGQGGV